MFIPDVTTKTITRRTYFVPDGTAARDLADAMRHVDQEVQKYKGERFASSDDSFRVRATDEGIELYFEVEGLSSAG